MGSRHSAGASCGCGKLSHAPAPCWAAGEVDISTFGGDEGYDTMPSSVSRARLGEASSGALASSHLPGHTPMYILVELVLVPCEGTPVPIRVSMLPSIADCSMCFCDQNT